MSDTQEGLLAYDPRSRICPDCRKRWQADRDDAPMQCPDCLLARDVPLDGQLDQRVTGDLHAGFLGKLCSRLIDRLNKGGFDAQMDVSILGHEQIVTQCGDNVLTFSDTVDTMWIHSDKENTMTAAQTALKITAEAREGVRTWNSFAANVAALLVSADADTREYVAEILEAGKSYSGTLQQRISHARMIALAA